MVRPLIDFLDPAVDRTIQRRRMAPGLSADRCRRLLRQLQADDRRRGAGCRSNTARRCCRSAGSSISSPVRNICPIGPTLSVRCAPSSAAADLLGLWTTASDVSFWSQLDYEGIDCYVPLSNAQNPTLQRSGQRLARAGDPIYESRRLRRDRQPVADPIFRGSRGTIRQSRCCSPNSVTRTTAGLRPNPSASGTVLTRRCRPTLYQAFFQAWAQSGSSSLIGTYFWDWDPNGSTSNVGPESTASVRRTALHRLKRLRASQHTRRPSCRTVALRAASISPKSASAQTRHLLTRRIAPTPAAP